MAKRPRRQVALTLIRQTPKQNGGQMLRYSDGIARIQNPGTASLGLKDGYVFDRHEVLWAERMLRCDEVVRNGRDVDCQVCCNEDGEDWWTATVDCPGAGHQHGRYDRHEWNRGGTGRFVVVDAAGSGRVRGGSRGL